MKRIFAALLTASFAVLCTSAGFVSAETAAAEDYDLSGFGANFPEVFAQDDTVTVTENSYKSHDVVINMSRHVSPYLSGDLNGDRSVTLSDVVQGCKFIAEQGTNVTEAELRNADADLSGSIDMTDIRRMIAYINGDMTPQDFFTESSLVYHIADIYVRNINSFRGCFAKGTFPPKGSYQCDYALNVAPQYNAIAMINADYVECRTTGVIWRNGVHYRDIKFSNNVCVLYKSGVMDVLTYDEYTALPEEQKAEIWQTSNFNLGLVRDGVAQKFTDNPTGNTISSVQPRSSVGYYEPGHYVFIQVDGRQAGYSAGMFLSKLAELYTELGVQEAYNLDGGSSSSLIFNNALYNQPAPVHVGDKVLGRPTSDFFYICEPSQITPDTAAEAWGDNPPET